MKYRAKNPKSAILVIVAAIALVAVISVFGIGNGHSAVRIGYVSHEGQQNWSASYQLLDGTFEHTLRPETAQKSLHIKIVTESGSLSLELKDAGGNLIFDKENIETSEFDVPISEKTAVRIEADGHRGSFSIEAAE